MDSSSEPIGSELLSLRKIGDFVEDEIQSRMEAGGDETDYLQEAQEVLILVDGLRAALSRSTFGAASSYPSVFLDCDGVLADFDKHAMEYFGRPPREAEALMGQDEFWRQLEVRGDFYRSMPVMPDAAALVDGVRHLNPTILTGCPRGNWAEGQKIAWAQEHFPGIPIITCRSADKRNHAKAGDVLIDDWPQHRHRWLEMGGHFISHYDAETSLAALWAIYPELRADGGEAVTPSPERGPLSE